MIDEIAKYVVEIVGTGTRFAVEDSSVVDKTDNYSVLRTMLSAVTHGMPKAKITVEKVNDAGETVVSVQPVLDGKGNTPNAFLTKVTEHRNPAVEFFLEVNGRTVNLAAHEMLQLGAGARKAVKDGEAEEKLIADACGVLAAAPGIAASIVMEG